MGRRGTFTEKEKANIIKLHDRNTTLEIAKSTGRDHRTIERSSNQASFNGRSDKCERSKNSPVTIRIGRFITRSLEKTL